MKYLRLIEHNIFRVSVILKLAHGAHRYCSANSEQSIDHSAYDILDCISQDLKEASFK